MSSLSLLTVVTNSLRGCGGRLDTPPCWAGIISTWTRPEMRINVKAQHRLVVVVAFCWWWLVLLTGLAAPPPHLSHNQFETVTSRSRLLVHSHTQHHWQEKCLNWGLAEAQQKGLSWTVESLYISPWDGLRWLSWLKVTSQWSVSACPEYSRMPS